MSQEKGVKFTNETLIKSCVCDGRNLNPKFGSQYAYMESIQSPVFSIEIFCKANCRQFQHHAMGACFEAFITSLTTFNLFFFQFLFFSIIRRWRKQSLNPSA